MSLPTVVAPNWRKVGTATGNVLNDDVVTVRASSTLTKVDGGWKLATRSEIEGWEGVAGCAVEQS